MNKHHALATSRHLTGLLALAALAGCAASQPNAAPVDRIEFVALDIPTNSGTHQSLLTAPLLDQERMDLVVVDADAHGASRVSVYASDEDTWIKRLDAPLRHGLQLLDIAAIGGRDRLITYASGEFRWFDTESAMERALVAIPLELSSAHTDAVPRVDLTRDLNHDGRDDLVVPHVDGFWISTQRADGTFTEPRWFDHPEPFADVIGLGKGGEGFDPDSSRSYRDVGITELTAPSYLSRVHALDHNQDGRTDLAFWNKGHFDVHHQEADGQFGPVSATFTLPVPVDSDGVYSRAFDYSEADVTSTILGTGKRTERTVVHSIRDLDGDGVADLVTVKYSGRSIINQRSVYEVRLGEATPDGLSFPDAPSSTFQPNTRAGALLPWGYFTERFHDFDGDGQTDIGFHSVRMGVDGMSRALVGNSIAIDLELFAMTDGAYTPKPTLTRSVRPYTDVFRNSPYFPVVLVGDANGDGLDELITGKSPTMLDVYVGIPGPDPFAHRAQKVRVPEMPSDERHVWMADMNGDGKQDIVMHHRTEPKHVKILITQ